MKGIDITSRATTEQILKLFERGEYAEVIVSAGEPRDCNKLAICNTVGMCCAKLNQTEAQEWFLRAINIAPKDADAYRNLASYFTSKNDVSNSATWLHRYLQLCPDDNAKRIQLVTTYQALSANSLAIEQLKTLAKAMPNNIEVLINLSALYLAEKNYALSSKTACAGLELNANSKELLLNLAATQEKTGDFDKAIKTYRSAIDKGYRSEKVWTDLAISYIGARQFLKAERLLKGLLKNSLKNRHVVFMQLGVLAYRQGQLPKAIEYYEQAFVESPNYSKAKVSKGQALLSINQFKEGWELYEHRIDRFLPQHKNLVGISRWLGILEPIEGRLFVLAEQGVGDEIMFAQALQHIPADLAVTVVCDQRLCTLFNRAFENTTCVTHKHFDAQYLDSTDRYCFIGSLPHLLRRSNVGGEQYLTADQALKNKWVQKFGERSAGLNIGLAWQGGSSPAHRREKSIDLKALQRFSKYEANWICVQYGDVSAQVGELRQALVLQYWPEVDARKDLDEHAGQLAALDLLICVDNSSAHLAAAMGVPTLLLLPPAADWRWGQETQASYWYASIKLLRRQPGAGWAEVLSEVEEILVSDYGVKPI